MVFGFVIFIALVSLGVYLYRKFDYEWLFIVSLILGGILFVVSVFFVVGNNPTANYCATVEGISLYFNDYQKDGDNIKVPSHYTFEVFPFAQYKYCDTPITIVVPEGQGIIIKDLRPQQKPYIVGGCK